MSLTDLLPQAKAAIYVLRNSTISQVDEAHRFFLESLVPAPLKATSERGKNSSNLDFSKDVYLWQHPNDCPKGAAIITTRTYSSDKTLCSFCAAAYFHTEEESQLFAKTFLQPRE